MLVVILKNITKLVIKNSSHVVIILLIFFSPSVLGEVTLKEEGILSSTGSNRATAYSDTNTIIQYKEKIYFTWQEIHDHQFKVVLSSYSPSNNEFFKPVRIGDSYDNHGVASIAIDSSGYLHVVYYPHSHPIKYKASTKPVADTKNLEFSDTELVGGHITYPKIIFDQKDELYLFGRKSKNQIGPDPLYKYGFFKKNNKDSTWQPFKTILTSDYPGYAHFSASIVVDKANTLHFHFRTHENSSSKLYGKKQKTAYLKMHNNQWKNFAGDNITQKIRFDMSGFFRSIPIDSLDILEHGGVVKGFTVLNIGQSALNKEDKLLLLHTVEYPKSALLKLSKKKPTSPLETTIINKFLPLDFKNWSFCPPTGGLFMIKMTI